MPMTEEAVFEKVREALVQALDVDEEDVTPQSTLTGDLGAESIDILDIVFRLENSFKIKIPRGELFPDNIFNNPQFVKDGKLTADGLAELKQRMPHADLAELEKDGDVNKLLQTFKVQNLVRYVMTKLS